jgi:hypothetical protein
MAVTYDVEPLSVSELAPNADLIVEGRLVRVKSYFWPEEDTVYTDYRLVPSRIIGERKASTASSPGQLKPAVVTMRGGEVVIEGTSVTIVDSTRPVLKENRSFLLFLRRTSDVEPRYEVFGAAAGMFEIDDAGVLHSMMSDNKPADFHGKPLEEVLTKIKAVPR